MILELGFDLGVDGITFTHLVVFLIFPILPFGFNIGPDAQSAYRTWAYFLRVMVNMQAIFGTLFFGYYWLLRLQNKPAVSITDAQLLIQKVSGKDLYVKITYTVMARFITFNFCRFWLNLCKVYYVLLFSTDLHTMDLFKIGVS